MLAIRLVFFWCKSGMATTQALVNCSVLNISNWNTKCGNMVSFLRKSSHTYLLGLQETKQDFEKQVNIAVIEVVN